VCVLLSYKPGFPTGPEETSPEENPSSLTQVNIPYYVTTKEILKENVLKKKY